MKHHCKRLKMFSTTPEFYFPGMNSSGSPKDRLRKFVPDNLESGKAVQVEVAFGGVVGKVVQFFT